MQKIEVFFYLICQILNKPNLCILFNCRDHITAGVSPSFQNPQRTFDNDDGEVVNKKDNDIPNKAVTIFYFLLNLGNQNITHILRCHILDTNENIWIDIDSIIKKLVDSK